MSRRKRRQEMQKIYMIRRIVALAIILLLLVLLIRRCGRKDQKEESQTINPAIQTGPITINENPSPTNQEENQEENLNQMVEEAISSHKAQMDQDYRDIAKISFDDIDSTFTFELIEDSKDAVSRLMENEGGSDDQNLWEELKAKLVTLSETLTESIEPNIKIQVANPIDAGNILLIKDGSIIIDTLDQ